MAMAPALKMILGPSRWFQHWRWLFQTLTLAPNIGYFRQMFDGFGEVTGGGGGGHIFICGVIHQHTLDCICFPHRGILKLINGDCYSYGWYYGMAVATHITWSPTHTVSIVPETSQLLYNHEDDVDTLDVGTGVEYILSSCFE